MIPVPKLKIAFESFIEKTNIMSIVCRKYFSDENGDRHIRFLALAKIYTKIII